MSKINFNEILFKHLIVFDYDTKDSIEFRHPHHLFDVEGTIHYKSLINDDYNDYVKLITLTNQKEHSMELFLKLRDEFDIERIEGDRIELEWDNKLDKYITTDGCHRLALIKYNKLDDGGDMPIEWFDIKK